MKKIILTLIMLIAQTPFSFGGSMGSVNSNKQCIKLIEKLNLNQGQAFSLITNYNGNLENISQKIYELARGYQKGNGRNFFFTKALIEEMLGNRKRSVEYLTKCLKTNPKNDRCYYAMGRAHRDMGEYEKSLQDFENAIKINPKIGQIYYGRSILYKKRANYRNAANDFQKFIELTPKSSFKSIAMESGCFDFSVIRDIKIKGCPSAEEYGKAGKWGKIKKDGEIKERKKTIPKECCDWECETYQTKCCEDWECADYNPNTGECVNWKCNKWIDCMKEHCRCVKLCGEDD